DFRRIWPFPAPKPVSNSFEILEGPLSRSVFGSMLDIIAVSLLSGGGSKRKSRLIPFRAPGTRESYLHERHFALHGNYWRARVGRRRFGRARATGIPAPSGQRARGRPGLRQIRPGALHHGSPRDRRTRLRCCALRRQPDAGNTRGWRKSGHPGGAENAARAPRQGRAGGLLSRRGNVSLLRLALVRSGVGGGAVVPRKQLHSRRAGFREPVEGAAAGVRRRKGPLSRWLLHSRRG